MTKIKVLVVFANPRNTNPLRLGTEDRAIQQALRRSRYRDNIEVTRCHAATIHDIRQSLLDEAFQIVHISGHGSSNGLVLEDDLGNEKVIPQKALAELFSVYSPPLQCVILNACYSISQGKLISLGVPSTIAMEGPIDDEGAIEFSHGFYDAIGAGRTIDFAYGEGKRTVALAVPNAQFLSKILKKRAKNPHQTEDISSMVRNHLPEEPALSSEILYEGSTQKFGTDSAPSPRNQPGLLGRSEARKSPAGQGPQSIWHHDNSRLFKPLYLVTIALIVLIVPLFFWLTKPSPPTQGFLSYQIEPATSFSTLDLTELGRGGWTHWGRGCQYNQNKTTIGVLGTVDHKRSGSQINVEMEKGDPYGCYYPGPNPVSWTDGIPKSSDNSDSTFIWDREINKGFTFSIPASTSLQTFSIYYGGSGASGTLSAFLTDNSASKRVVYNGIFSSYNIYTVTYKAASAGQLKITYMKTSGASEDSINLVAAWLVS